MKDLIKNILIVILILVILVLVYFLVKPKVKGAFEIFPYNTIINQCAFSGQASKRMNEATGMPASTIHRLLKFQGEKFTFDEENPLPIGVYILDEVSMVGLELFWSLIRAIPTGSKLIMLGDNGQLPPIGIGNLLSDLMNASVALFICGFLRSKFIINNCNVF